MRFKTVKPERHMLIISLSVLVFVVCLILATKMRMPDFERKLFDEIYGWSGIFEPLFWVVTQLGGLWVFLVGIAIFFWQKKNQIALKLLATGFISFSLVQLLKTTIGRGRPEELISGIVTKENFAPGFGFPSGHATTITVVVLCLAPYLKKRYRPLAYFAILAVATSRVYLGVHSPLDVVAGVALGVAVVKSYELIMLKYKLEKPKKRA